MVRLLSIFLLLLAGSVSAENLLKNGSFEAGQMGWLNWIRHDKEGNTNSFKGLFVTGGNHGDRCLKISYAAYHRAHPIWLNNGTTYYFSYDAIRVGASSPLRWSVYSAYGNHYSYVSSHAVGTSWTRYNQSYTCTSSGWYTFGFNHFDNLMTVYVDAVMVSTSIGGSYTSISDVEGGLEFDKDWNVIYSSDAKTATYRWFNDGSSAATDTILNYQIYDIWNKQLTNGYYTNATIAADSSETTTIVLPNNGFNRVVTRLVGVDSSRDEGVYFVAPFDAQSESPSSGQFMSSPTWSPMTLTNSLRTGFPWVRAFGMMGSYVDWWTRIESEEDSYDWSDLDTAMASLSSAGSLVCWTPSADQTSVATGDPYLENWMTEGSGTSGAWKTNAFYDFIYDACTRYSFDAVEIWNEPSHSHGEWIAQPTNYARLLARGAAAVKAASPSTLVVAMGGAVDTNWVWQVWTNLDATAQGNIDVISFHWYPYDNNEGDNMMWSGAGAARDFRPLGARLICEEIGLPWWNTESGTYTAGSHRTEKGLWTYRTDADLGSYSQPSVNGEWDRSEQQIRSNISTERIAKAALRTLANGADVYTLWTHDSFAAESINGSQPYAPDQSDASIHPAHMAVSTMSAFLAGRTDQGSITNAGLLPLSSLNDYTVEMFWFDTAGSSNVMAFFSCDRNTYNITLTNTSFTLYDVMGNEVSFVGSVVQSYRMPQYAVSTTLTLDQLKETFEYGTITSQSDTNAPYVSIDIAPTGQPDGSTSYLFKWSGNDTYYWNDSGGGNPAYGAYNNKTNIIFSYSQDLATWSTPGQAAHAWLTPASDAELFAVKVIDRDQNVRTNIYYYAAQTPSGGGGGDPSPTGAGLIFNVNNFNWRN